MCRRLWEGAADTSIRQRALWRASGLCGLRAFRARRRARDRHDDFDLDAHDDFDLDAHDELDLDGHDKVERSPAAQLPPDTRLYRCQSRSGYLEPDATLMGGPVEDRFAVLVEYDRTDRPHKQIDRLRRYDWWLLEGWRETHFATHSMPPTVIFLTSRERPLRRLVETADQVLSAWYGREDASPCEGTHPAREQILFTSRDRIRAGDWTMERTPSLPPVLRVQPDVRSPRSVVYDMPSMFAKRSFQPSDFALIPGGRDGQ